MYFEAFIYDAQDAKSEHPESSLGIHPTVEDAVLEIAKYLKYVRENHPQRIKDIVRAEVLPCTPPRSVREEEAMNGINGDPSDPAQFSNDV